MHFNQYYLYFFNKLEPKLNKEEILKSATMLCNPLTDEQRMALIKQSTVRQYRHGEIIFSADTTPTHLYYLHKGKVTMVKKVTSGNQHITRMVSPQTMFGYAAGFSGTEYMSTAVAGDDTEIVSIPLSIIFNFVWENASFAMLFIKELSTLLGLSVQNTINLTQKHIRGRLAESLLQMRNKYGVEEDGVTLPIYLSRNDLAQMSNMTTSNAIRTLSSFAQEGIIGIEGRKIKILNVDELQKVSDRG